MLTQTPAPGTGGGHTRPMDLAPAPTHTDTSGDHDRFAHYAPTAQVTAALIEGTTVQALCGKRWTPTRDPDRYPLCPTCAERYAQLA